MLSYYHFSKMTRFCRVLMGGLVQITVTRLGGVKTSDSRAAAANFRWSSFNLWSLLLLHLASRHEISTHIRSKYFLATPHPLPWEQCNGTQYRLDILNMKLNFIWTTTLLRSVCIVWIGLFPMSTLSRRIWQKSWNIYNNTAYLDI